MGSLCSTIYDDIADPSEGQFMWQPKNGKRVNYYRKSKIYKRNSMFKDDTIKEETLKDLDRY